MEKYKENIQAENPLGTAPVGGLIRKFAIPAIISMLVSAMYNIVDQIFIGQGVGMLGNAATNVAFPVTTIATAMALLLGIGGASNYNLEMGAGREKKASGIAGTALSSLAISGAVLCVIVVLFLKPLLTLFGATKDVMPYAVDYTGITALGLPFYILSVGGNHVVRADRSPTYSMACVTAGAVINTILDPLFIFGLHMGVRGAALATIISQLCSAIWVLRFLTGKKAILNLKKSAMKISWKRVGSIVSLGMSSFFMAFTSSLVQVVCNATLQTWGGDIYVGVMTVLNSVRDIFTMPVQGLTAGASPVMSFNYGEKAYDRVKKAIKFITAVCVIYTLAGWGILKLLPEFFIRIFNSNPGLLEKGVSALHIYFFGFCFMALQFTGQSVFVALGKAKKATFFSLFRKVVIVVPLTVLLPHVNGLGTDGVFWAEPVSNLVGGCACFFTMLATVLPELNKRKA